jgi:GntR family transcriptional regulator, transcriptional repressor for pyruvate dehydrogenase complex
MGVTQIAPRRAEPRRLYQQIADQVRNLIRDGQFPPLSRLPAERDLAQQLGVSRPSLREALIALEIEGCVEIRTGSGVYVSPALKTVAAITRQLGDSPSELMEARSVLEGSIVALACARMTAPALSGLNAALERMRAAVAADSAPLEEDRRFHVAIAHQTGNSVLVRLVGDLFDARHSRISQQIRSKFEDKGTWTAALTEHEAVLASLQAADPLGAEAAMRAHLRQSAERWTAER